MKTFIFPVIKHVRTSGFVAVRAESLDKAEAVKFSQPELEKKFRSTYSDKCNFEKQEFNKVHQQLFGDKNGTLD